MDNINLVDFYSRLGTIAIILALGFFLGRFKLISPKTNKDFVNLLLLVFMPASLFMAFPTSYSEETSHVFIAGLIGGVIVMLSLVLISLVIFNKKWYSNKLRYESQFALIFNNATFLGYPIISSTFGPQSEAVIAYCGFIIAFNIALFSYGVYLFKHKMFIPAFLCCGNVPSYLSLFFLYFQANKQVTVVLNYLKKLSRHYDL